MSNEEKALWTSLDVNANEVNETLDKQGGSEFVKLDDGLYNVKITGIEATTSKSGKPMLNFYFELVSGNKKGCKYAVHKVLTSSTTVGIALGFIKSLLATQEEKSKIHFESMAVFAEKVEKWNTYFAKKATQYKVEIKTENKNSQDYQNTKILKVYAPNETLDTLTEPVPAAKKPDVLSGFSQVDDDELPFM